MFTTYNLLDVIPCVYIISNNIDWVLVKINQHLPIIRDIYIYIKITTVSMCIHTHNVKKKEDKFNAVYVLSVVR